MPAAVEQIYHEQNLHVSPNDGENVAVEIGAVAYLECSSLTGQGVEKVFETATRAALEKIGKGRAKGHCLVQ